MKIKLSLVFLLGAGVLFTSPLSAQENGQALFEQMRCARCHDREYNKLGPPLKTIAGIYENEEQLVRFFKGETKAIVKPDMAAVMEESLAEISKLAEQEKSSLASYIMRYK